MRRWGSLFLCFGFGLLAAGCPKGQPEYNQGKKAETIQDYDAAFVYYQKAVKADPYNAKGPRRWILQARWRTRSYTRRSR